jgi:hypothetical protein
MAKTTDTAATKSGHRPTTRLLGSIDATAPHCRHIVATVCLCVVNVALCRHS